jgi:hypothetical protein
MKRGKKSKKKIVAPKKKKVSKSKKVVKKKVSKKKNLNNKKLLAISIAAFFIFAFALAFVNNTQEINVTGQATDNRVGDPLNDPEGLLDEPATPKTTSGARPGEGIISDFFGNWETGNLDTNIAKYLFFFMLLMLIFSVLKFAKFPPNGFLQFLIALPVAFLSSAYLVPAEVLTILQSYEALGIVLSFILPFVILLFFSAMLVSNEKIKHMSMPKIILEVFLWIFFTVVLGYKIISGIVAGDIPLGLNLPIIIMGTVFLISCAFVIFNTKFRNWMWKIGLDIRKSKAEATRLEAIEVEKTRKSMVDIEPEKY